MRRTWSILSVLVVLALVAPAIWADGGKTKTHDLTVTVVSVDVEGKTITFEDGKGARNTAPVKESAVAALKNTEAGEKVTLTCQDDADGHHEGVTAIAPAQG